MSIVKWSTVRIKTKDKLIPARLKKSSASRVRAVGSAAVLLPEYLILNIDYAASSQVNCTRKMISSRDIVEMEEVFKPGTKVKLNQDTVYFTKDEICVVKEENSQEQLGEIVYTLRSVDHPDVTEKMKSDYFSEIGFGICRHDRMFI